MNIVTAFKNMEPDIADVVGIADNIYKDHFENYFSNMRQWYSKFSSTPKECNLNMTDSELEVALTELPLELFAVSEKLSQLKLNQEVVKLRIKELEANAKALKIDNPEIDDDKLIQSIYSATISRVENEISFSREFIMVMKKFWDARRATEQVNPVNEVSTELPEYTPEASRKRYVK